MAGHVTAQHPEVSSGRRQQVQVNRRLVRFKFRHCIFKLGVIGVLVAVFFIVFGLCGPGWASHYYLWTDELYQSNKASVAAVRVLYCVTITGIILSLALEAYQDFCKVPPPAENKAVEIVSFIAVWFQLVRVLVTFGLAVLVLSASLEVYCDVICRLPTAPADNAGVELLASLGGLVGLAGVVLFATEVMTYPPGLGPYRSCRIPLFWAWGLQAAGSLLALLSAAAMGCSREKNSRIVSAMTKLMVIRHKMASEGVGSYHDLDMAVRVTPVVPNQWDSHV